MGIMREPIFLLFESFWSNLLATHIFRWAFQFFFWWKRITYVAYMDNEQSTFFSEGTIFIVVSHRSSGMYHLSLVSFSLETDNLYLFALAIFRSKTKPFADTTNASFTMNNIKQELWGVVWNSEIKPWNSMKNFKKRLSTQRVNI